MYIQWAIKGIWGGRDGLSDSDAKSLIDSDQGIQCNWWRAVHRISPPEIRSKLIPQNLSMHVNQYDATDPTTGMPFRKGTPFISLTSGCVERNIFFQTNTVFPAKATALAFATESGLHEGYLFYCWVIVGLNPAVEIEGVSEEVRELNSYRSYSAYQTEGEITAKIYIPANQIHRCEKYSVDRSGRPNMTPDWTHSNPKFSDPAPVTNLREAF